MADNSDTTTRDATELYRVLELPKHDSARVLDILPGPRDSKIQVKLQVIWLHDKSFFEALSYSWGTSVERHSVLVNEDYEIPVTDNLFRALRALRYRSKVRTI